MEIFKKINNNVALARDAKGRELVVFGKGIGFPTMPYELDDLAKIQRTFYDVNEKYFDLLRDAPEAILLAADDIADTAREELDCELNPNLVYTLADHLNFAVERAKQGVDLRTPLAYDIRHLYPREYAIALEALHNLGDTLGAALPESEAVSIAMHLITAESQSSDMHATILTARIITELSDLVESGLDIRLDKDSFSFSRFAMHLRYLVQRMMQGEPVNVDGNMDSMFMSIRQAYPQIYTCVVRMSDHLQNTYGWCCSREEQLYLMMHVHRVCAEGSRA